MIEYKEFLKRYNDYKEDLDKLSEIHDAVDQCFSESKEKGLEFLKNLLIDINKNAFASLSEMKTALVVSKPFKESEEIKDLRHKLHRIYLTVLKHL